jgi:hypothetical protein
MAAGDVKLHVDVDNGRFVNRFTDPSDFILPKWHHEDQIPLLLDFYNLNTSGGISAPFSLVTISGASLEVKIVDKSAGTILASQTSWTADTGANTLRGVLNLNTVGMAALFPALPGGAATTSITARLTVKLNNGTGIVTVDKDITILREYNQAGSPTAVPGTTYYTSKEVNAIFARKLGLAGETITFTSPDGTQIMVLGVRDTGEVQMDVI